MVSCCRTTFEQHEHWDTKQALQTTVSRSKQLIVVYPVHIVWALLTSHAELVQEDIDPADT